MEMKAPRAAGLPVRRVASLLLLFLGLLLFLLGLLLLLLRLLRVRGRLLGVLVGLGLRLLLVGGGLFLGFLLVGRGLFPWPSSRRRPPSSLPCRPWPLPSSRRPQPCPWPSSPRRSSSSHPPSAWPPSSRPVSAWPRASSRRPWPWALAPERVRVSRSGSPWARASSRLSRPAPGPGRAGELDVLADLLERRFSDAVDVLHLLEPLEWAVLVAVVDDGLGLHRPDAVQGLEVIPWKRN